MFREPPLDLPKLRALCRQAPYCFIRIPGTCEVGPVECVHDDSLIAGRGHGRKSSDTEAVPGCRACHQAYHADARGYQAYVTQGARRWRHYLWTKGLVGVL